MNNENTQGQLYIVGTRGYSAYEVAVQNGFEGTEEEWLESLVGPQGDQGVPGESAYQIAVDNGYEGTEEEWVESFLTPEGYVQKVDIVDNLESTAKQKPLSANQGRALKALIDGNKSDIEQTNDNLDNLETTLSGDISSEITNRQNADIDLQSQITSLASGSPLVAADTTEMTDTSKVYVNTTDGHWYYYDGDSWEDGGLYQSTAIADNSVTLNSLKPEVINDRYGSANGLNKFNPFDCTDKKGFTTATGAIVDHNTDWISGKMYFNSGDFIFVYINDSNKSLTPQNVKKMVFFDSTDDSHITTRENLRSYTAPQNCYMRLQVASTSIPFEDRFKLQVECYPQDSGYSHSNSFKKLFEIYTTNNKYNINPNIKIDELSDDLRNKLYVNDDIKYELGSYYSSSGNVYNNSTAIRSINYAKLAKNTVIKVNDNSVSFALVFYKKNNNFIYYEANSTTDWEKEYKLQNNVLCNIIIKYDDGRTLTTDDIETLKNKVSIIDPVEYLNIYADEHTKDGTEIIYTGEPVNLKNKCYFSSNIGIPTSSQDGCIYGNTVFEFGTNGTFKTYDMDTKENYGTFNLHLYQTIKPHCNSACFGNEFYDDEDDFPLLYINAYNTVGLPEGTCYVHRVVKDAENQFTTELLQTIQIGFTNTELWKDNSDTRPYGNFAVDTDNDFLYVFNIRNTLQVTRFFKFKLPKISDGETIVLRTEDIIEYFDTPFQPYIQGCQYYQNKIYSACGINSSVPNSSAIRVIDLVSKGEVSKIETSVITNEPETIFFHDNKMVFGGAQLKYIDF